MAANTARALTDRASPAKPNKDRTADLLDTRFRALLGPEDWHGLPHAVQQRFSKRVGPGDVVVYLGAVTDVRASRLGRVLAQALRLIGGPLPLVYQPGPAVVTVSEDRMGQGQVWTRSYMRPDGFPQTLHSAKRFSGSTGLEEHLGFGIVMALRVRADNDGLIFTSDHYRWQGGAFAIRLPGWLEPGRLTIVHRDLGPASEARPGDGRGRFAFTLELRHPVFGLLMRQRAEFEDPRP